MSPALQGSVARRWRRMPCESEADPGSGCDEMTRRGTLTTHTHTHTHTHTQSKISSRGAKFVGRESILGFGLPGSAPEDQTKEMVGLSLTPPNPKIMTSTESVDGLRSNAPPPHLRERNCCFWCKILKN